jgi:biofilm PGA synthesis protein PgaA
MLKNRYRLYGHELRDSGDFGADTAERTRGSAGLRYNYNRQEAWAEFGHDTGTNRNAGNMGTSLRLNDFWTVRAEADSDSFDVPVRAVTGHIHGRSLDMDVEWRASELRSAHIGLQRLLFSEGNQRAAISGDWDERIWTSPRWQTSIRVQGWESSNSMDENRPYFNPKQDFSLGPRGTFDWLTWQRYDRSFQQRVEFYIAPYWQAAYKTEDSISAHYEQFWKLGSGFAWHYGVTWNSQPYDGVKETSTSLSAGVAWGSQ